MVQPAALTKLSLLWNILGPFSNTAKKTHLVYLYIFLITSKPVFSSGVKISHKKRRQKFLDNKKLFLLDVTGDEFVAPDLTKILGCPIQQL